METFGIIGMSLGVFGLLAFIQVTHQQKELSKIVKALKEAGIMKDDVPDEKKD